MDAAIGYLEGLGRGFANPTPQDAARSRVENIRAGMAAIASYERTLSAALLDEVGDVPGLTVFGVSDRSRLDKRVPTLCFDVAGVDSMAISHGFAARDIGLRAGHMVLAPTDLQARAAAKRRRARVAGALQHDRRGGAIRNGAARGAA